MCGCAGNSVPAAVLLKGGGGSTASHGVATLAAAGGACPELEAAMGLAFAGVVVDIGVTCGLVLCAGAAVGATVSAASLAAVESKPAASHGDSSDVSDFVSAFACTRAPSIGAGDVF